MSPFVWAVILFLIAVNALYVAAEFASVSARRSRIRNLTEDGNGLAARLLPVLEDSHQLGEQLGSARQISLAASCEESACRLHQVKAIPKAIKVPNCSLIAPREPEIPCTRLCDRASPTHQAKPIWSERNCSPSA